MNYIVTGLILIALTGCGSNSDKKDSIIDEPKEDVVKETSPQNIDKSQTPPAIPKL